MPPQPRGTPMSAVAAAARPPLEPAAAATRKSFIRAIGGYPGLAGTWPAPGPWDWSRRSRSTSNRAQPHTPDTEVGHPRQLPTWHPASCHSHTHHSPRLPAFANPAACFAIQAACSPYCAPPRPMRLYLGRLWINLKRPQREIHDTRPARAESEPASGSALAQSQSELRRSRTRRAGAA
jgi:hypothetical protein